VIRERLDREERRRGGLGQKYYNWVLTRQLLILGRGVSAQNPTYRYNFTQRSFSGTGTKRDVRIEFNHPEKFANSGVSWKRMEKAHRERPSKA
jgi:hypothetical protein